MNGIEEKRKKRSQFLHALYKVTEGRPYLTGNVSEIARDLGLDEQEAQDIAEYLLAEGLLERPTTDGSVEISHLGIREVEEAPSEPHEPAAPSPEAAEQLAPSPIHPKVFVIHAGEDHDFVLPFGDKLRSKGIDAWVDDWEIAPGDSLVDKVFGEGIESADALIIVLSKYSVQKAWVREELNAGVVKRITEGTRLIPVVLDECEVPLPLRATVWQRISDRESYHRELEAVIMSIYGHRERPPLGEPPPYARDSARTIPGLMEIDSLVLMVACEEATERGSRHAINATGLETRAQSAGIAPEQFYETLEILEREGCIETRKVIGPRVVALSVILYGFEQYAKAHIVDYAGTQAAVAAEILNRGKRDSHSISVQLNKPRVLVDTILQLFEEQQLITTFRGMGGPVEVATVHPALKRWLEQQ